ncbi:MAG: tape measure protein, partial [Eubacterium sp.]|nr:tape measure protein [Eubacterium sp.]
TMAAQELEATMQKINNSPTTNAQWQSDNLEVFNSSGAERFQQEIQSANNMLNVLNDTQTKIAQQALQTKVFPANMASDLSNMQNRIQGIQARIQTIESNPLNLVSDTANAELEQLRASLNQAVSDQETLNRAVENMDVEKANAAYLRLSSTVSNTERYIRDNIDEQGRFNKELETGESKADGLKNKIASMAATYLSLQGVKNVLEVSDNLTQTTARLDMMNQAFNESNGTAKKTDDLVKLIYQSAQNARGEFDGMADVVARFGNNAKDAFSSQKEVVAFSNLIQKQMTIAGASTQESFNAMLQLSQALGSGVLRGDEFNSINEQAPNIIQSIADYLDVPKGKIREMAAEGQLTADVVKAAMFNSADEINAKFDEMPMTWGQVFTLMKNTALMQFQPVLDKINELANNPQFQEFATNMISLLASVANVALSLFEIMASAGSFVVANWSWIAPILIGVATAIGAICIAKGVYNTITAISNTLDAISTARSQLKAGASLGEAAATSTAAGAQVGLNAALLACPLTWIILGIIALIVIISVVIAAIKKAEGETTSALGIILGVIFWVGALIIDFVIGVINGLIQLFWAQFVEPFIGIIEWVLNVANGGFDSFGGAVANLVGQIISWFLTLGKVVTTIIDAIFGTDWTGGLSSLQSKVTAWGTNDKAITISHEAPQIKNRIGLKDAYSKGYNVGSNLQNIFGGGVDTQNLFDGKGYTASDYDTGKIPSNIANTADNTGKTADSLEITSEDLKYLRDIAEKEVVNRFTTAEIRVEMTNNNNISSDMDLDGVIDYLTVGVNNAMEKAAEGAHV